LSENFVNDMISINNVLIDKIIRLHIYFWVESNWKRKIWL